MAKIPDFEVEQWMDTYETTPGVLNVAETCASSISISQLAALHPGAQDGTAPEMLDLSVRMTYGAIRGSDELRRNIAALYADDREDADALTTDNILVTQGAIAANHLVLYALIGPGDHVICVHPTYQQLYTVPATLGAEVSLWEQRAEDKYIPDVRELKGLIRPNTKMIIINNPNNPTGTTIPTTVLESIIAQARTHNITVLCDEAYSPLYHSLAPSQQQPPSALSLPYQNIIVTSTMSKAWALAGIRLGWAATRSAEIMTRLASARDYTAISVSQLDDQVARFALSPVVSPALQARNMALARTNLALLGAFVRAHVDTCAWIEPTAGTTAFVRFSRRDGQPVDDEAFCKDLLATTGVLFVPGARCFGSRFRGFVRIGYVSTTEVLRAALEKLDAYIAENLN
ncbi:PLP-dependent transferase [Xylaria nigripes]|nr:PLP-dependent transferase [Xylaria nigripes]